MYISFYPNTTIKQSLCILSVCSLNCIIIHAQTLFSRMFVQLHMCVCKQKHWRDKLSQQSEHLLKSIVCTTEKYALIIRIPKQSPQSCLHHMLKDKVHVMWLAMSNLSINNFVITLYCKWQKLHVVEGTRYRFVIQVVHWEASYVVPILYLANGTDYKYNYNKTSFCSAVISHDGSVCIIHSSCGSTAH